MDINQIMQILAIFFGSGGAVTGGFAFYKWWKNRPMEEKMGQLEAAKKALDMSTYMLNTASKSIAEQELRINELSEKLKKTKLEFEEENNKIRTEFKEKQQEMEQRICYLFNLFEMQLLSFNVTPILPKETIMDAKVEDLKKLVDDMRDMAGSIEVTEEEKNKGINKWSKMLDKFSSEFHKDIERIIIGD